MSSAQRTPSWAASDSAVMRLRMPGELWAGWGIPAGLAQAAGSWPGMPSPSITHRMPETSSRPATTRLLAGPPAQTCAPCAWQTSSCLAPCAAHDVDARTPTTGARQRGPSDGRRPRCRTRRCLRTCSVRTMSRSVVVPSSTSAPDAWISGAVMVGIGHCAVTHCSPLVGWPTPRHSPCDRMATLRVSGDKSSGRTPAVTSKTPSCEDMCRST